MQQIYCDCDCTDETQLNQLGVWNGLKEIALLCLKITTDWPR